MEEKAFTNLKYLPVISFLWMVITFFIPYYISVSLGHIYPIWPYISDTGTIPPESCIFGFLLNIFSLLMASVFYVRYVQINMNLQTYAGRTKIIDGLNTFCLILGMLATLGSLITASFQETSHLVIHLLGANLAFSSGSVYSILHTIIGFIMNKNKLSINLIRTLLCILYILSYVITFVFAKLSFDKYYVDIYETLLWNPNKPGYDMRLASTFSEWLLAFCQGLYLLSFTYEFRYIGFQVNFAVMNELPELT